MVEPHPHWAVQTEDVPMIQRAFAAHDRVYLVFVVWPTPRTSVCYALARMLTAPVSVGQPGAQIRKWDKTQASYNRSPLFRIKFLITRGYHKFRWPDQLPFSEPLAPGRDEILALHHLLEYAANDETGERTGKYCAVDRLEELTRLREMIQPPCPVSEPRQNKRASTGEVSLPKRQTLHHYFKA